VLDVLVQPQPRCRPREDAGERCLPHNERIASKIIAIKFDQVEGIQKMVSMLLTRKMVGALM